MGDIPKSSRRRFGDIFTTEDDIHRDYVGVGKNFFSQFAKPEEKYEYVMKEHNVDRTKKNADYERHKKLALVKEDTMKKTTLLRKVLAKRILTPEEKKKMQDLSKKDEDETINRDEEQELRALREIEVVHKKDLDAKEAFSGLRNIYYYKDAFKTLTAGSTFVEWNNTVTKSAEVEKQDIKVSIAVVDGDILDKVSELQGRGLNPMIALCGSRLTPGNRWELGLPGLEEDIFYRSSACIAYADNVCTGFYPLMDNAVLYAPKIMLFKKSEAQDYAMLGDNQKVFFSMLVYAPEYMPEGTETLSKEVDEIGTRKDSPGKSPFDRLLVKFRNIFQTALYHGHDSIVMNPVGLGLPGNYPVGSVCEAFKTVLFGPKRSFYQKIKRVVMVLPHPGVLSGDKELISRGCDIYRRSLHGIQKDD